MLPDQRLMQVRWNGEAILIQLTRDYVDRKNYITFAWIFHNEEDFHASDQPTGKSVAAHFGAWHVRDTYKEPDDALPWFGIHNSDLWERLERPRCMKCPFPNDPPHHAVPRFPTWRVM